MFFFIIVKHFSGTMYDINSWMLTSCGQRQFSIYIIYDHGIKN